MNDNSALKPEKSRTRQRRKRKNATPSSDAKSINEDRENFHLAVAMKELIVLDNGNLIENLETKISNGEYSSKVDTAIEKLKDRKDYQKASVT